MQRVGDFPSRVRASAVQQLEYAGLIQVKQDLGFDVECRFTMKPAFRGFHLISYSRKTISHSPIASSRQTKRVTPLSAVFIRRFTRFRISFLSVFPDGSFGKLSNR